METMKSDAGRGGLATKIREAISELDRLRMAQRYGLSTDVKPADHNIVIDAMRAVDLLEHFTDAHGSEPPSTDPRAAQENKAEAADSGAVAYTHDQQRAADYIVEASGDQLGGGDDPVGFLIESHRVLREKAAAPSSGTLPNTPEERMPRTPELSALIEKLATLEDDGSEGMPWSQEELDMILVALRANTNTPSRDAIIEEHEQDYAPDTTGPARSAGSVVEEIRHLPIMDRNRMKFTYPMALAALDQGANALADLARRLDEAERRCAESQHVWSELRALVACTSPDGSAELGQVRLLQEHCAELEKDAGRYRWMREHWVYANGIIFFDGFQLGPFESLDAAIDAAIAGREERL